MEGSSPDDKQKASRAIMNQEMAGKVLDKVAHGLIDRLKTHPDLKKAGMKVTSQNEEAIKADIKKAALTVMNEDHDFYKKTPADQAGAIVVAITSNPSKYSQSKAALEEISKSASRIAKTFSGGEKGIQDKLVKGAQAGLAAELEQYRDQLKAAFAPAIRPLPPPPIPVKITALPKASEDVTKDVGSQLTFVGVRGGVMDKEGGHGLSGLKPPSVSKSAGIKDL